MNIQKNTPKNTRKFFSLAALLGALVVSGTASAAVLNGTLTVNLEVVASCNTVTNTVLTFAQQNTQIAATVTQDAEFNVTCAQGSPYQVALDFGLNSQGSQRRMRSQTGEYLAYEIYKDSGRQTPWSESDFGQSSATGDGVGQPFKVYGRVLPQVAVPGKYSDAVKIAVIY